jgi:hypothetical protein
MFTAFESLGAGVGFCGGVGGESRCHAPLNNSATHGNATGNF